MRTAAALFCLGLAACTREPTAGEVDLNAAAQAAQADIANYAATRHGRLALPVPRRPRVPAGTLP